MVDTSSIIATVQEQTGGSLSNEKAGQVLGAVLSYAKQHGVPVPEQAQSFVDNVEQQNQSNKESGEHGNLMENAMGFLSSVQGGDDDATKSRAAGGTDTATNNGGEVDTFPEMLSVLTKFGISPQQVMSAVPMILKLLKDNNIDISPIVSKIPGAQAYLDGLSSGGGGSSSSSESAAAAAAPAPAPAADITTQATEAAEQATKDIGASLLGSAQGFLGGFGK
jgi:pyruvate/2-oxoglutarate dehydrogenase complex dihydrolipoamide acyltransferase (E2) component